MSVDGALPLEARDLRKRYGHVVAVDGVDLTVHAGDIYGFLGPNGLVPKSLHPTA
jgi:ABC-2 type transport system ATP-binding protein